MEDITINQDKNSQLIELTDMSELTSVNSLSSNIDNNLLIGLAKFQSICPAIEKNRQAYGYKYADQAMIIKTIAPVLKECNLGYTQLLSGDHKIINIKTIIFSTLSNKIFSSVISSEIEENQGKQKLSTVQRMGATITYLKRYALCAALGVVSEDDPDGTNNNNNDNGYRTPQKTTYKQSFDNTKYNKKLEFSKEEQEKAIEKIKSCNDLEQLKECYLNLGDQKRNPEIIQIKNELKDILEKEARGDL